MKKILKSIYNCSTPKKRLIYIFRNNLNTLIKRIESLKINRSTFNENSFSDFKILLTYADIKSVTVHRLGMSNDKIRPFIRLV